MHLSYFPVQLKWHSSPLLHQEEQLGKEEKLWLMSQDSLTHRLKAQGNLSIQILHEGWIAHPKYQVWQRDVLLCVQQKPWIFARTIIPQPLLLELPFKVCNLGIKPLGEQLFNHPQIKHTHLKFTHITKVVQEKLIAPEHYINQTPRIWGRSRGFMYQKQNFSIFEFFLDNAQKALRR